MGTEGRGDFECARCHSAETFVTDSRGNRRQTAIRRRRECVHCGFRFTTYETVDHPQVIANRIERAKKALSVLQGTGEI